MIIGHSAGGWLALALLAELGYETASGLVSLGTPHTPRGDGRCVTRGALAAVAASPPPPSLPRIAVAGRLVRGDPTAPRGSLPARAAAAYGEVGGAEAVGEMGDGVVPTATASPCLTPSTSPWTAWATPPAPTVACGMDRAARWICGWSRLWRRWVKRRGATPRPASWSTETSVFSLVAVVSFVMCVPFSWRSCTNNSNEIAPLCLTHQKKPSHTHTLSLLITLPPVSRGTPAHSS